MQPFPFLPAPLMSRARPGPKPSNEGQGQPGSKKFCPGLVFPKVGGRCTHYWWMRGAKCAKSLIVDSYSITSWVHSSTICGFASTNTVFCSTSLFLPFSASFSFFSFVYKEKREIKASTKEGVQSTSWKHCLFFRPPVGLRFSRNWWIWWMKNRCIINRLEFNPPISTNPPVFCHPLP